MAQVVPIDQIRVIRDLEPGDDVSQLAKHIADSGLKMPILVDGDGVLIDGLRRLEALRSLGMTTVEVVHGLLYPNVCEHLKRTREHGVEAVPLKPRRIWQIYKQLQPIFYATKAHFQFGVRKGGAKRSAGGRNLLYVALGLKSSAPLQAISSVYRAAEGDPNLPRTRKAQEAVALLDAGEITIYAAVDHMTKERGLTGNTTKYEDQKRTLEKAAASLRGMVKALENIGPLDSQYPVEDLEKIYKELFDLRSQFYSFVRRFKEEINNK